MYIKGQKISQQGSARNDFEFTVVINQ